MKKSVLVLKSSPRDGGNSAVLADQVAAGAAAAGAQVKQIFLHGKEIKPCQACDHCADTGVCIIDDDMQAIYPEIKAADALVLASPIYWFTYNAQLKTCIDRWYALWNGDNRIFCGKRIGIVLAYGDSNLQTSGGINAVRTFESMCAYLQADIAGIVHGSLSSVGDARKHPDLMEQAYQLGQALVKP